MRWSLRGCALLLSLASTLVAEDGKPSGTGRLTTGCVDRSISTEHCRWIVRYQPKGRAVEVTEEISPEQQSVQSALGQYAAVQPPQIQGSRASVLVQRTTGEFAVVSLAKTAGKWAIVSVDDPTPAHR